MKVATINLSLPKDLLKKVDDRARKESRNRSELLREAARSYLEGKSRWDKIFSYADRITAAKGLKQADVDQAIREARRD